MFSRFQCPHAECSTTCASDDLDCYVLDNNAYIIVSENSKHTGRFFGEVHGLVMDMLVEEKIYDKIVVYDYQAVCFPNLNSDNSGNILSAVSFLNLSSASEKRFFILGFDFSRFS